MRLHDGPGGERETARARARGHSPSPIIIVISPSGINATGFYVWCSYWCARLGDAFGQYTSKQKNKKKMVQRSMDSRRWNKNNHHSALSHTCCAHLEGFGFTRQSRGRQLPYEWERKTVPICNLLVAVWTRALFIRYVLIILFRRITVNRSTVSCDAEDDDYPYQEDTMSCIL